MQSLLAHVGKVIYTGSSIGDDVQNTAIADHKDIPAKQRLF
jgi:hypothetical protein